MEISGTKTRLLVDFFKRKVDDSQQIPSEISPVVYFSNPQLLEVRWLVSP